MAESIRLIHPSRLSVWTLRAPKFRNQKIKKIKKKSSSVKFKRPQGSGLSILASVAANERLKEPLRHHGGACHWQEDYPNDLDASIYPWESHAPASILQAIQIILCLSPHSGLSAILPLFFVYCQSQSVCEETHSTIKPFSSATCINLKGLDSIIYKER